VIADEAVFTLEQPNAVKGGTRRLLRASADVLDFAEVVGFSTSPRGAVWKQVYDTAYEEDFAIQNVTTHGYLIRFNNGILAHSSGTTGKPGDEGTWREVRAGERSVRYENRHGEILMLQDQAVWKKRRAT